MLVMGIVSGYDGLEFVTHPNPIFFSGMIALGAIPASTRKECAMRVDLDLDMIIQLNASVPFSR